jgi:pilus assembly protein Flp/PilA
MTKMLSLCFEDQEGATAVEYAIMVSLIAVIIVTAVSLIGEQLMAVFQTLIDLLTS